MKVIILINLTLTIISAMVAIAFYTLSERKFLGYMQHRKGPNKPTILALTIPMADAIKLFTKEEKYTTQTNINHYLLGPTIIIIISLLL